MLLHMAAYDMLPSIYIYISDVHSYTGEYPEDFTDSTGYGSRLGDFAKDMLDSKMEKKR